MHSAVVRSALDPLALVGESLEPRLYEPPRSSMINATPESIKVTAAATGPTAGSKPPAQAFAIKQTTTTTSTTVPPPPVATSGNVPPALEPGTVIMSLPSEPRSSIPEHVYTVSVNDPKTRPWLPDYSGNAINLASFQTKSPNAPRMMERLPTLPFWPTSYNRAALISQMNDIELFIRAWRPKQIPEIAFTSVLGWTPLRSPAPVYVMVPHFGVGVAMYYRWGNAISKPILYYAVRKLAPLPLAPNEEWVGSAWEVFASWCKPMKWAISRLVLPDTLNPAGSVLVLNDEGFEFQMDFDTLKNTSDPRLIVARNALMRDYPEMITRLAIRRTTAPPEILREMAKHAAIRTGTQAVIDGNGYVGPRGDIIQRPQTDATNEDEAAAATEEEDTPETAQAASAIGSSIVVRLGDASVMYPSFM